MEMLTLDQLARFCGAESGAGYEKIQITGISRDNRAVKPGDLFVAIQGASFDGHEFVNQAAAAGAAAALVSKRMEHCPVPTLLVEDTVKGLQDIAREYRGLFDVQVVGITGSVGKTTTKEMCACVLSQGLCTLKTQGNLNNDIGLPFTVMNLNKKHQAAVLEMGANHFGEIARLTRIARPDIAIITAIGESHIEFLGSKDGVRRAKLEILEGLSPDGMIILNGDDPMLWELKGKLRMRTIYCGIENEESDVFGELMGSDAENIRFSVRGYEGRSFHIRCGGLHNLRNALMAIAVGAQFGRSVDQIAEGLESFVNTGPRQKILQKDGVTIISDCYNASPDSMRAALEVLRDAKCPGRKIAALGDMLELGEHAPRAHFEVGKCASECADMVCAAGEWARITLDGAKAGGVQAENARYYQTVPAMAQALQQELADGDILLVKGSRGMRMEQIVELLTDGEEV